jgi:hypothetical protein
VSALNVPGYHSNAALLAEVERLVARAPPGVATLESLGPTVRGTPIPMVRASAPGAPAGLPRVLVSANVHGNEVISSELAMALLRDLCAASPSDAAQALLGRAEVLVVPAVNLDSREPAAEALIDGRLFQRAPRGNANGVDLNRNFPWVEGGVDPWHPMAGTAIPWLPWYRGPEPLSEPESRALADLARGDRPVLALNIHSVGRYILYPWNAFSAAPPDAAQFQAIGEAFCAGQPAQRYELKQAQAWYGIMGDMDDWLYDSLGTLALTVELSGFFEAVAERWSRLFCPASWMNPVHPRDAVLNSHIPSLLSLLEGLNQVEGSAT